MFTIPLRRRPLTTFWSTGIPLDSFVWTSVIKFRSTEMCSTFLLPLLLWSTTFLIASSHTLQFPLVWRFLVLWQRTCLHFMLKCYFWNWSVALCCLHFVGMLQLILHHVHDNSISCLNITYLFPVFHHSCSEQSSMRLVEFFQSLPSQTTSMR